MQEILNDFYVYDFALSTWTEIKKFKGIPPSPRSCTKSAVIDNKIYYFGGYLEDKYFNDLVSFDTINYAWE